MIGLINNFIPLRGLSVLKHQKLRSNLWHYSTVCRNTAASTTSLTKPISSRRGVSQHVKPPSAKAKALQTKHGVPLSYDIIYNSFEYHTVTQYLSAGMSAAVILKGTKMALFNTEELFPDLFQTLWTLYISSLFLYINIGTAIIAYKSPVRIYYSKETGEYKAIFHDVNPTKFRTLEFKKGMVKQIPPPDMLTLFRFSRYKIKDQELYMFDTYFRYPGDLYGMFDELETEEGEEE